MVENSEGPVDERSLLEFESPRNLAEIFPHRVGAPPHLRRCSVCGANSQALPAEALTVIKHRHGAQDLGHMRLYCDEHLRGATEWRDTPGGAGGGRIGKVCPTCFISVPLGTGICESCGVTRRT